MRVKTIQYAICQDTGQVISRYDGNYAWPILNWDAMKPENNFTMTYFLEKISFENALPGLKYLKWTRKIPMSIKNLHRQFWNMKPLKEATQ